MEVLVDTDAVRTGAAASGDAWQYYPLGNGDFCTHPFYAACPHRMACARCEFHLPAESQVATALLAKEGLQHMLLEMPLDEDERAAVEGGVEAMDTLIAKRRNTPTPDGRTPMEINSAPAASSSIALSDLASSCVAGPQPRSLGDTQCPRCLQFEEEIHRLHQRLAAVGQHVTYSPGPSPTPKLEHELQRWLAETGILREWPTSGRS